jgi:hypothetical protein
MVDTSCSSKKMPITCALGLKSRSSISKCAVLGRKPHHREGLVANTGNILEIVALSTRRYSMLSRKRMTLALKPVILP